MAILPSLEIRKPRKSVFNRNKKVRLTSNVGTAHPVICESVLPGDNLEFNLGALIKTHAALAPIFGSFKVQFDMFFAPYKNYIYQMRVNNPGTDYSDVQFPYFTYAPATDYDFYPANGVDTRNRYQRMSPTTHTLEQYFGIPVGYYNNSLSSTQSFNALPLLSYWDIYLNYYVNQQEDVFYNYDSNAGEVHFFDTVYTDTAWNAYPISQLRNLLDGIKQQSGAYAPVMSIDAPVTANDANGVTHTFGAGAQNEWMRYPACRTYLPDYFTATLNKNNVDAMLVNSAIDVSGGTLTQDQFIMSHRMYKLFGRQIAAGERWADWIRAQFGVTTDDNLDIPQYLGSKNIWVNFEDVVSTSNTKAEDSTDVTGLGELAGRGHALSNGKNHYFNFTQHGTFMVIMSIVPEVAYNQGVNKFARKLRMSDVFVPAMDAIGYQDVFAEEYYAGPRYDFSSMPVTDDQFDTLAIRKQPAWLEYMTNHDQNFGDFAGSLDYWVLNRDIATNVITADDDTYPDYNTRLDYSAYINPSIWNKAFVDQTPTAHNFQIEIFTDQKWTRCISKQLVPTL